MMMGNAGEALREWQAIGERIKRVRQSAGMTTSAFALELGTSMLNIDIIENLSRCDKVLLREPQAFAKEMQWSMLLQRISNRFALSEEWLRTGEGDDPIATGEAGSGKENDYEFVVSVPLMISRSALVEGANMIVAAASVGQAGTNIHHRINTWLYSTLTDLFLIFYHGMSVSGLPEFAGQATEAMLNAMRQHPCCCVKDYEMNVNI